ncbi:ArnT family glycosyltransferase [Dyella telluris]|uniref:Glycosyltransferase RgtA/B/C/D-like domain-containing protein n=1 Tax=Dyella telluris TaxID=2763498 RepID=A0A7G8Q2P3_9GAMM|nr:hypothetical protein [Dyella telluris]QNK01051.1 hypothetical protein H8F01_18585 [Dyella telluris]
MPGSSSIPAVAIIILLLLTVALPRLMLSGGLPTTDEGFQAYYAQIMHASMAAGRGLPDAGPLMLYPLLGSWVFAFGVNPMVALRLLDLLFAVASGYAFFRVIELESRSRWGSILIAGLFLFTMNLTVFIQYGYKNSIHAAYLPLFAALWLGLRAPEVTRAGRWLSIGALVSLAVLLRETFLPFIALGGATVLISRGTRACIQFVAGAFAVGVLITVSILAARGGVAALLGAYKDAGLVYSSIADQRITFFLNSGGQALGESAMPVLVAVLGLVVVLVRKARGGSSSGLPRSAFWICAALLPMVEPATKIGFPYHFGVCLVGLAGLAALGWRELSKIGSPLVLHLAAAVVTAAFAIQVIPRLASYAAAWPQTREVLIAASSGQWPESLTDKSNYLLSAAVIRQLTPPGASIAISGFMYSLYPLTGHVPATPGLANLSATFITLGHSSDRLREALLRCPPDVVMTTSRTDWPGSSEIRAAVRETGIYEEVGEIPSSTSRQYGNFGGAIFRAKKHNACRD